MRKLILSALMAASLVPAMASAQTPELRHDRHDVREQQRDLRDAQLRGDRHDVRDARHDLRDARRETREDWRDYRRTNPGAFRGPAYVGPRGWRYRPVSVGYRLEPGFWGSRYVIDPIRYRLPPVAGPTRWVRYGNDVLLVNVRTGRVITVHNGFFY
jgi:Ni/Co efflux regulator RcnB